MRSSEASLNAIPERIIGTAYTVSCRLLEKACENALAHELRKAGLHVTPQGAVQVRDDGVVVGAYIADLLVEQRIIVEPKAVKALDNTHLAQCLNVLKVKGLPLCLLMNCGNAREELKRMVHDDKRPPTAKPES